VSPALGGPPGSHSIEGAQTRAQRASVEAYYSDNNGYTGIGAAGVPSAAFKAYDSGMSKNLVVFGSTTGYCISEANGTHMAKVVGPGGTVYTDGSLAPNKVTALCTSATG
jgi:hypothetical protein